MGRVYLHTASTAVIICRRRDTPDISAFSGIEAFSGWPRWSAPVEAISAILESGATFSLKHRISPGSLGG
jgi:hypothetical protein